MASETLFSALTQAYGVVLRGGLGGFAPQREKILHSIKFLDSTTNQIVETGR